MLLLNKKIFPLLILVQCFAVKLIFCANILILESVPSPSHHLFFRTVAKSLAAGGHNVTSINSDGDADKIANVHNIVLEKMHEHLSGPKEVNILDYGKIHQPLFPIIMQSWSIKMSEGALISAGFDQLLNYPNNFQFDLIIYDYDSAPYLIGFLHKFNYPPMIGMSVYSVVSVASPALGSSFSPYIPYHAINDFENKTSFLWRVNNFLLYFMDAALYDWYVVPKIDQMMRPKFPKMPYIGDLEQRAELVLINNHPLIQRSQPMLSSNMIRIGGAHILPPNPLPDHLKAIFHSGRDVILMSFGSTIKSSMLGVKGITEIIETFRSLPQYTFIWKFDANDVDQMQISVPENVKLEKWLPQNDILAQPSLKLFITHAGPLSTQEAVWHGVPMIGFPAFLDQYINIEECVRAGIAEILEIQSINRESFKNTILKIMETPSYRHNARKKSNIFRDEKDAPLERAIWWINYIIRNGNATFLSSPVKGFNVYERQNIDIVVFLTVITIILFAIFYYIFKHILKCLTRKYLWKKSDVKRD